MLGPGGEKLTGRIVRGFDAAAAPKVQDHAWRRPADYDVYLSFDYVTKLWYRFASSLMRGVF